MNKWLVTLTEEKDCNTSPVCCKFLDRKMGILKLLLGTVQMKYCLVPCAVSAKCGL